MSKSKFQTVYGVRIFPIEYLMNEELSESDLNYLIDTKSFLYSIIIGMYRETGSKKQNCDIIKDCKKNNKWISNHRWTSEQFYEFENKLIKIIKNIYYVNDIVASSKAQWFMIKYGFSVKGNYMSFE